YADDSRLNDSPKAFFARAKRVFDSMSRGRVSRNQSQTTINIRIGLVFEPLIHGSMKVLEARSSMISCGFRNLCAKVVVCSLQNILSLFVDECHLLIACENTYPIVDLAKDFGEVRRG